MVTVENPAAEQDTIRVSALHAFAYCPRLFYLEEVEELYTQDAAVFAGRRLHVELEQQEDEEWEEHPRHGTAIACKFLPMPA